MQQALSLVAKMMMMRIMRMRRRIMKIAMGRIAKLLVTVMRRSNSSEPSKRPLFSLTWG